MSDDIIREVYFLLSAILLGAAITFVYDFILILRRLIRHSPFYVSAEDFIFWAVCAIGVFYMLYKENNGVLRWFAVAGAGVGMIIYKGIIGRHFVHITSTIIHKEVVLFKKIGRILWKPLGLCILKIKKAIVFLLVKVKKLLKFIKKKLTVLYKLFKITLCKH